MNRPNLATDVVPLAAFRAHAAETLKRIRAERRPTVLTQRGHSVAIVLCPEDYEELAAEGDVVRRVLRGLQAADRGELVDDDDAWREVDAVLAEEARR
jgi:PHD/YefM family antitoxin component YafN of YafNO toxin-antitoxin module